MLKIYAASDSDPWVCASSGLRDKSLVRLNVNGRRSVVLSARATTVDEVAAGELVAPQWALDILGVGHGGVAAVELLSPSVLPDAAVCEVRVAYVAHQSHRHWDDVATATPFSAPGTWSPDWPGGVSRAVLRRMLPVLLRSRQVVVDSSILVLHILDVSMVSTVVVGS